MILRTTSTATPRPRATTDVIVNMGFPLLLLLRHLRVICWCASSLGAAHAAVAANRFPNVLVLMLRSLLLVVDIIQSHVMVGLCAMALMTEAARQ